MFSKTTNPYKFQYLETGISGPGIEQVYLPKQPKASEILFKKEQKFVKQEMPPHLRKAAKEWLVAKVKDPEFIHPLSVEITAWEDQEWERSNNGMWFWNNGVATYITGFYYWYLTAWKLYFGPPTYRETDKEITYWVQWWEENPECFGGLLNTIRRYGKSAMMGAWLIYRTTRNHGHFGGAQGENDSKIEAFYNTMVLTPFRKLPYYYKPTYDTSSEQNDGIKFTKPIRRAKDVSVIQAMEDEDDDETLGSEIDWRNSKDNAYDQAPLMSYVGEELGKVLTGDVSKRWAFVKPCLRRGVYIRGKMFGGTTVEFMDVSGKGGKAYKELFFESDVNNLQEDGRTISGLVAAFLPGDCAYEGFFDDWGHPMRERAKRSILIERDAVKNNPEKHSALIRKYPLTIKEIFWINAEHCEFNATILQDRASEIDYMVEPIFSRFDCEWRNKERFSEIVFKPNPINGFVKLANFPWALGDYKEILNKVDKRGGVYTPMNDNVFGSGVDPVDHGVVITTTSRTDDEFKNSRRSRPVMFIKTKYDAKLDGMMTQEILEKRALEKFQYKSNRYFMMMDTRPNDPNVYFERALMLAWAFGVSLHVENQKPGMINYFHQHNCGNFILSKYVPDFADRGGPQQDGSAASTMTIQEYTSCKATYIEYFGHTIPFKELLEDDLQFNPRKTTEFDYSVASGWTELACKMRPKVVAKPILDISTILRTFDMNGNVTN